MYRGFMVFTDFELLNQNNTNNILSEKFSYIRNNKSTRSADQLTNLLDLWTIMLRIWSRLVIQSNHFSIGKINVFGSGLKFIFIQQKFTKFYARNKCGKYILFQSRIVEWFREFSLNDFLPDKSQLYIFSLFSLYFLISII